MHHGLIRRYIELQALLITPIAPHWAEYIWLDLLNKVCALIEILRIHVTDRL